MTDKSSSQSHALRREFAWRGRFWSVALAGAAFAAWGVWSQANSTWVLALCLWLGYCAGYVIVTMALDRQPSLNWSTAWVWAIAATALGIFTGSGAEFVLSPELPVVLQTHIWLHAGFCAVLILTPVGQIQWEQRTLQQAQAEKAQLLAELQSLQAQIEPHFLFNTLATLRSMVRQKSPAALTLLDRISEFLETVLPRVRDGHSTLGRELNIVQQYLSIMQLRLGSRLRFDVDTAKLPLDIAMPSLLLQPLVENAIAHGIEPSECGGEIRVTAERIGRLLKIRVFNTGTPLGDSTQQHGMALKNLAERLQVLYDDDASFELLSNSDGTAAVLTFPVSP